MVRSWPVLPGPGQLMELAGACRLPLAGVAGGGVVCCGRDGLVWLGSGRGWWPGPGWCGWCCAAAVSRFARVSSASVSGRRFRYVEVIAEVPALAERKGSPG